MSKKFCCICHKEIPEGSYGNNPSGAIDSNKKVIQWSESDRCCDECNSKYVLPGRMYRFYRVIKNESLVNRETE